MKEAAEKARLKIAIETLRNLINPEGLNGGPVTRGDLIVADSNEYDKDPEMPRALRARAWQKAFVARAVELGLLERFREGDQDMYRAGREDLILVTLNDWMKHYGELISKIVFGGVSNEAIAKAFSKAGAEAVRDFNDSNPERAIDEEHIQEIEERLRKGVEPDDDEDEDEDAEVPHDVLIQLTGMKKVFEGLIRDVTDVSIEQRDLKDAFGKLRSEVTGSIKQSKDIVSTAQGLLRKLTETEVAAPPPVNLQPIEVNLEALTKAVTTVIERDISRMVVAVQLLSEQQKALNARIEAIENDRLGHAVKTAEAALEMLTELAAERT